MISRLASRVQDERYERTSPGVLCVLPVIFALIIMIRRPVTATAARSIDLAYSMAIKEFCILPPPKCSISHKGKFHIANIT